MKQFSPACFALQHNEHTVFPNVCSYLPVDTFQQPERLYLQQQPYKNMKYSQSFIPVTKQLCLTTLSHVSVFL
jgi:hypothetical protein